MSFSTSVSSVFGHWEGSSRCTNKIIERNFSGSKSGNVARVFFEAGWDQTEPAEAAIVIRRGHAYWQVLTKIDLEDYTWDAADLILK